MPATVFAVTSRFELRDWLGTGGMRVVYAARSERQIGERFWLRAR